MARDTALMYFWQYNEPPSEFLGLYPNGEKRSGYSIEETEKCLDYGPWAASNGRITEAHCNDVGFSVSYDHSNYRISKDTLFIWDSDPKNASIYYRVQKIR